MKNRLRKSLQDGLSPWGIKQDSDTEQDMTAFCQQRLPRISVQKQKPLSDRINEQYREILHPPSQKITPIKRITKRPQSNAHTIRDTEDHRKALERLSSNKQNRETIKTTQKTFRLESKPSQLQEISRINFIMQGARSSGLTTMGKKKQSTFVMKQKFAQIRRSMNLAAVSSINRAFRYNIKEDKENALFKLTKFQLN